MVELRHLPDNSPSLYSGDGFTSEPGDIIDVDDETADELLELDYYVREEDYDAPDASEDAGGPDADDATVTTADFEDDEIEVSDAESTGKTEAQQEMDFSRLDDENPDPDADMADREPDTADFRDDEIEVADADSDGKTEAQQDAAEYQELVADGTVVDVQNAIDGGEVDDLDALEAAEREYGGERVGVLDAIESERSSDTTETDTGTETDTSEDEG